MEGDIINDDEFFGSMPPGYLFHPRDDELIYYLILKTKNEPLPVNKIHEVNLYESNPQNLAEKYKPSGKNEWYFFTPREKKYKNGSRPNRAAGDGYWRASGADTPIKRNGEQIGCRKTLTYLRGKPGCGKKTEWIMIEFRVTNAPAPVQTADNNMRLDDWVLCKLYKKTKKLVGEKRSREAAEDNNNKIESKKVESQHPNGNTKEAPIEATPDKIPNNTRTYPQPAPLDVPAFGSMIPFDYRPVGFLPGVRAMVPFDRQPGLRSVDIVNNFPAPMNFAPQTYPGPSSRINNLGYRFMSVELPYYHQMNCTPMPVPGSLDEVMIGLSGLQCSSMDGLDDYCTAMIDNMLKGSPS